MTIMILILGQSCHWKHGVNSAATKGYFKYSLCSSSLSSCTDGECDALERLHQSLCPQDCVHRGRRENIEKR